MKLLLSLLHEHAAREPDQPGPPAPAIADEDAFECCRVLLSCLREAPFEVVDLQQPALPSSEHPALIVESDGGLKVESWLGMATVLLHCVTDGCSALLGK